MLNLLHRVLKTGQNAAPVLHQYVPQNDTKAKSPTFVARDYWNNLPVDTRNIVGHECFKNVIRNMVKDEYIREERTRLFAGQFIA